MSDEVYLKPQVDSVIKVATPAIGRVSVMATATTAWIRGSYNDTTDIVQRWDVNANNLDNLTATRLIKKTDSINANGSLLKNPIDELAPVMTTNNGNVFGNHGCEMIKLYSPGHGKTTADIGSRWSDGTYKHLIWDVPGPDTIITKGAPYVSGSETIYRRSSYQSSTLTHDSGAVHAQSITVSSSIADQKYPSTKGVIRYLLVDNVMKPRDGKLYRGENIFLVDSGGIIHPALVTTAPTPSTQGGPCMANAVLRQGMSWNGCVTTDLSIIPLMNVMIRDIPIIQIQKQTSFGSFTDFYAYFTNVKPVTVGANTYNFAAGALLNTVPADILITRTDLVDNNLGSPRGIFYMKNPSTGQRGPTLNFGYVGAFGNGTAAALLANNASYIHRISTAGKDYPGLFTDKYWNDTPIYAKAYYIYTDPGKNDSLLSCSVVPIGTARYQVNLDCQVSLKGYRVTLPAELAGMPISVIDSGGTLKLITRDAAPGNNLIVNCSGNGYLTLLFGQGMPVRQLDTTALSTRINGKVSKGGDAGAALTIGTTDANTFNLITNNTNRFNVTSAGVVTVNGPTSTADGSTFDNNIKGVTWFGPYYNGSGTTGLVRINAGNHADNDALIITQGGAGSYVRLTKQGTGVFAQSVVAPFYNWGYTDVNTGTGGMVTSTTGDMKLYRNISATGNFYLGVNIGGMGYFRTYQEEQGYSYLTASASAELLNHDGSSISTNKCYYISIARQSFPVDPLFEAYVTPGPTITVIRPSANISLTVSGGKVYANNSGGNSIYINAKPMQDYSTLPLLSYLKATDQAVTAVQIGSNTYVNSTTGAISVGNAAPSGSAALQVDATDKGMLPPRMTTAQRNAISSPPAGLTLYCTDCTATDASTGVMQTYNGSGWKNNW